MTHPYRNRREAITHIWLTPRSILDQLGEFDLDPCAAQEPRPWPTAKRMVSLPDNGLAMEWVGRVWLNPPFGTQAAQWLKRMAHHGDGIALMFARTETVMFAESVWPHASAIFFLKGRPRFCRPDGTEASGGAGGPIVLIAYGSSNAATLQRCNLNGKFVPLPLYAASGSAGSTTAVSASSSSPGSPETSSRSPPAT